MGDADEARRYMKAYYQQLEINKELKEEIKRLNRKIDDDREYQLKQTFH